MIEDLNINVATVNGSGSQSANNLLVRTLFRMGWPVAGKNLFPSNISGLATWFAIRANKQGFLSRQLKFDVVICLNPATFAQDVHSVRDGGFIFYNADFKTEGVSAAHATLIPVPFRELLEKLDTPIKMKKLLYNMIYVGILSECLGLDQKTLNGALDDMFATKKSVLDVNHLAITAGQTWAKDHGHSQAFPLKVSNLEMTTNKILIDGNSAAALGAHDGGCHFMSWYPITPSSSLAESVINYGEQFRRDSQGKRTFASVQAEDELSAINMVVGAGWAGARAMTATSGPGLSLMSEAAGLAYFAEIPAVIWDVQRAGPSTGLPTRTLQGDVASATQLSHGDTEHLVLFPGNPSECFSMAKKAFDLAERFQTLVIVLSDLDLGMNFWVSDELKPDDNSWDRGKVLNQNALDVAGSFSRYKDFDGDGVCYRTLPGTQHAKAAYFTRGTGHDENARYSEDNENFRNLLDRLKRKFITAKNALPSAIIDIHPSCKSTLLCYGSSESAVLEARAQLLAEGKDFNYVRVRSFPFQDSLGEFLLKQEQIFVVEQNRDQQLLGLLAKSFPNSAQHFKGINQYDGLPLAGAWVKEQITRALRGIS